MEERWLLYIDFLGTKNIIKTEHGLKEFENMIELLSNSNSSFSVRKDGNKSWTTPEFTSFSDHIAVSYPVEYELIESLDNPEAGNI